MAKSRLIWMLGAAAVFIGATWLLVTVRNSAPAPDSVSQKPAETLRPKIEDRYLPANFEAATLAGNRLTLSGAGSPKSAASFYRGEDSLGSEKLGDDGRWEAEITLEPRYLRPPALMIESITKLPDGTDVKSDECVVLITQPDDGASQGRDAILVVSPGAASRVIGIPFDREPDVSGLTLHSAEYDNAGGVIFSGRSNIDGRILISANSVPLGETGMTPDGEWMLISGLTLPVGTYSVDIERLDGNGQVTAKMTLPFERRDNRSPQTPPQADRDSASLQTATDASGAPIASAESEPPSLEPISVEFGEDYWTLSRALYGGGWQHTILYAPIALVP